MCHPGRIGGDYRSQTPPPRWLMFAGSIGYALIAVAFATGGWILIGGCYLVRKCR